MLYLKDSEHQDIRAIGDFRDLPEAEIRRDIRLYQECLSRLAGSQRAVDRSLSLLYTCLLRHRQRLLQEKSLV